MTGKPGNSWTWPGLQLPAHLSAISQQSRYVRDGRSTPGPPESHVEKEWAQIDWVSGLRG